jgi:hypothetical protein
VYLLDSYSKRARDGYSRLRTGAVSGVQPRAQYSRLSANPRLYLKRTLDYPVRTYLNEVGDTPT